MYRVSVNVHNKYTKGVTLHNVRFYLTPIEAAAFIDGIIMARRWIKGDLVQVKLDDKTIMDEIEEEVDG
jgi:hypothetical protein